MIGVVVVNTRGEVFAMTDSEETKPRLGVPILVMTQGVLVFRVGIAEESVDSMVEAEEGLAAVGIRLL